MLINDINIRRNQWLLGRVIDVISDKFSKVRSATVRTFKCKYSSLKGFGTIQLDRPITKLVLLCRRFANLQFQI